MKIDFPDRRSRKGKDAAVNCKRTTRHLIGLGFDEAALRSAIEAAD